MSTTIDAAYDRYCTERPPLPTEERISAIEDELGITFPGHYRDFLLNYNGGWFGGHPELYSEEYVIPKITLSNLFGVDTGDEYLKLNDWSRIHTWDDNDPIIILPIGKTPNGFYIVLVAKVTEEDYGQIYLRTFDDIFFLDEDIEEFFELWRDYKD